MRIRTVKYGIYFIAGGIFSVIMGTFFHSQIAELLMLSRGDEAWFIFLGLMFGAMLGCTGIIVSVTGFLHAPRDGQETVLPAIVLLLLLILLFFFLLFFHAGKTDQQRLRPGESIVI